jgi:hypothetical protein
MEGKMFKNSFKSTCAFLQKKKCFMKSSLGKAFGIFGNPVAWEKNLDFFFN